MLKRNRTQFDFFTLEVYSKLLPNDHLLVQVDQMIDFETLFEKMSVKYSNIGRGSKDPVMMIKIMLLEYIYGYSDVQMEKFIQTDIAIRWFLKLNLDEKGPDATTISHFRVNRITEKDTETFFNEIVKIGIDKGVVKAQRFIIDSTDVAANSNYPSEKKLLHSAFDNIMKQMNKEDPVAVAILEAERSKVIKALKLKDADYSAKELAFVLKEIIESIPSEKINYYIQRREFEKSYKLLFDLFKQQFSSNGNKIVSVVDSDARIAHKSSGNVKKGYKNHIIIDEESEIIISSLQTPFNVNDDKKLIAIIEKSERDHGLKPAEVSCDKAYGTYENRQYLEDRNIQGHIAFYNNTEKNKENIYFGIDDFRVSEDLDYAICPAGIKTYNYMTSTKGLSADEGTINFKFPKDKCKKCLLNNQCVRKKKTAKSPGIRTLSVDLRYSTVLKAKTHNNTKAFKTAYNRRYIVERRFATLVKNHGLRRSRYLGMVATSKHILMANLACNVIRLLKLSQQFKSRALYAT